MEWVRERSKQRTWLSRVFQVLGVLLCVAVLMPTLIQRPNRIDLDILLLASERLEEGTTSYVLSDENQHTKPPFTAFLLAPLLNAPRVWVWRAMDVLVMGLVVALALYLARWVPWNPTLSLASMALLSVLLCLNSFNAELRHGQYNVLALAGILYAARGKSFFLRVLTLSLSVLFKPSMIFFLPWIVFGTSHGKKLILGCVSVAMALSLLFVARYGFETFVSEHRQWLSVLSGSVAQHLPRVDNYGLPSLFESMGFEDGLGPLCWLGGLGFCFWIAVQPWHWMVQFALLCLAATLFSSMTWLQNYILLIPLSILVLARFSHCRDPLAKRLWGLTLVVQYLGFQVVNPETCRAMGGCGGLFKLPLMTTLAMMLLMAAALLREKYLTYSKERPAFSGSTQ